MSNLSVGDKVMTIGRLIGKIYAIDDDSKQVTLNVGTDESETLIVIDKKTQSQPLSTAKK
ncbi:MAG: preprotein translocase subunit YajC [Clostridiales bacterium]|nr:MAG: preprotein translocase subunit YajC [Clostridiales bacterium]